MKTNEAPEGKEREKAVKNVFKEILTEIFPNLGRYFGYPNS